MDASPAKPADAAPLEAPAESYPADNLPWPIIWAAMVLISVLACAAGALAGASAAIIPTLVLLFCLLTSAFDLATGHIPNALTYPAILMGLALNCLPPVLHWLGANASAMLLGAAGPTQSLLGLLACGALGIACFLAKGIYGGDVKLLAALGAMLGFRAAMVVLALALVAGVVYSLANLVLFGHLNSGLRKALLGVLNLLFLHEPLDDQKTIWRVPLGVPVAIALVLARVLPVDRMIDWLRGMA